MECQNGNVSLRFMENGPAFIPIYFCKGSSTERDSCKLTNSIGIHLCFVLADTKKDVIKAEVEFLANKEPQLTPKGRAERAKKTYSDCEDDDSSKAVKTYFALKVILSRRVAILPPRFDCCKKCTKAEVGRNIFVGGKNVPSDFRFSTFRTAGPLNQYEAARRDRITLTDIQN
jgi:hypothetical protein